MLGAVYILTSRKRLSEVTSSVFKNPDRIHKHANAFFLGVTISFLNAEDKATFKRLFNPLADYVRKYELSTLSYELYESDQNPLQIFILERYIDKAAYIDIHRTSKPFLLFKSELEHLKVTVSGHSYIESNLVFSDAGSSA